MGQTMTNGQKSSRIQSLGQSIRSLANSRGWDEKLYRYQTWRIWDETVGPQIAAHARPHRLRKNVLEITVDQPVWMQQLQLMKPQLLKRLNARLPKAPLEDIFLRRGRIPPPEIPTPPTPSPTFRPLTNTEEERITSLLESIPDVELKECLKRIFDKQTGLNASD